MSNDLHQEEEDVKSTPVPENEEDESENWFEEEKDESDVEQRLARMEKGLNKFFSEQGRTKKKDEVVKEVPKQQEVKISPVVEKLYFNANPEAKIVWDEVKKAATLTGKDPFELYEEETFFKEKALRKSEENQEEQSAKEKINGTSKKIIGTPSGINLTDEEKALLRRRGLTEKDINKYKQQ
jgi:hypothetical protein